VRGEEVVVIRIVFVLMFLQIVGPFAASLEAAADEESEESKVRFTILANEGLLIRSADAAILIDALIAIDQSGHDAAAAPTIQDLLAGRPPFSSIALAIVSHPHREHFDAVTAGTFLKNHTETVLVSTAEVVQMIRDEYPEYPAIRDRVLEVGPSAEGMTALTVSGIELGFMLHSHEAKAFYPESVLTPVIQLGGMKILYLGDSEIRPQNWQPYDLRSQNIDIVVLPFWLFKEEALRATLDEEVAPKRVVVSQIPLAGPEAVVELEKAFPEVVFLNTPMASAEF
jgi:L-ascorbate metabolism protein UlaG (beta-lactamase superfamily)